MVPRKPQRVTKSFTSANRESSLNDTDLSAVPARIRSFFFANMAATLPEIMST